MKLSVCCIVKNDTFYLEMMLKSVLEFADEIIIVEDSSDLPEGLDSPSFELCMKYQKVKHHYKPFGNDFGKGRQFANDQATGDWIFFLDADEVIHENNYESIKPTIEDIEKAGGNMINVQYIHFYNNFSEIDNSEPVHIGLSRIYKNGLGAKLNLRKNHTLPVLENPKTAFLPNIIIWHLGYLRGMEKIKERFDRNYNYSEMHHPIQQLFWRDWHYYGNYPTKKIDVKMIPQVIKDGYHMELGGTTK